MEIFVITNLHLWRYKGNVDVLLGNLNYLSFKLLIFHKQVLPLDFRGELFSFSIRRKTHIQNEGYK